MPEYLQKRYGGRRLRVYFAIKELVLTVTVGLSVEMLAISIFVKQILGWNVYASSALMLAATAVYTIGGGLAAVLWTDTIQSVIIIIGTMILSINAMSRIGGYESMVYQFPYAMSSDTYLRQALYGNISCGIPPSDYLKIFREMDSAYPWSGITIGNTITASAFFCTSQVMVQRVLSAKSVSHGKGACVFTSYLKFLPFFLFMWPGMVSRILYPDEVACSDPETCHEICENRNGCTDVAFPLLVLRLLPSGLRGLMLAAMLAASMSTLTSQFNAASALFTLDIWKYLKPKAKDVELVIVGRLFTVLMIFVSFAWLPVLMIIRGSEIWHYLQAVASYTSPPWIVVFLVGALWKRTTEKGAWWGLMAGAGASIIRLGIEFSYKTPGCGDPEPDKRPAVLTNMHYFHFAILLATITLVVQIGVSLITTPRTEAKLHRVTWWTRLSSEQPELTDDGEDIGEENNLIPVEESSKSKRILKGICGLRQPENSREKIESKNVKEDPFWARVCDINAILVISCATFLIGFFA